MVRMIRQPPDGPVAEDYRDPADDEGQERRHHRRDQHLAEDALSEYGVGAAGHEGRPHHPADQGMRRARR